MFVLRWWDCIALPVDVESSDEAAFRMQIRSLAFTVVCSNKWCLLGKPSLDSIFDMVTNLTYVT